jgi:GMP synthase (glutamine-hydrolysing)
MDLDIATYDGETYLGKTLNHSGRIATAARCYSIGVTAHPATPGDNRDGSGRRESLRVLVIENEPAAGPGKVGEWLIAEGIELNICRPYAGDVVPEYVEAEGLLVLGGAVGPHDDFEAPWLPAVRALLRRAVEEAVPTWGICLGAQLLAAALGGIVERGAAGPEVGLHPLQVEAKSDPLFGDLPAISFALQFHQEAVTKLPKGAVLLASNDAYENQAFRVGSCAWGVQFHPEVSKSQISSWSRSYPEVSAQTKTADAVAAPEIELEQSQLDSTWSEVTRRWAEQVRGRAS